MTAVQLDKPAATLQRTGEDWERHKGHGGPKIKPPPGVEWLGRTGKPVGHRYYTRVTTFAKAIDDLNKLMAWKMRGVLVGLGQRPAYVTAAAALTMEPRDRDAADELAEKALQAARADDAALVGTAIHTWTERLDRGEPLGYVPPQVQPLVDAYARLTAPLTMIHREVRTVCDELETAGTPDAVGYCSIPDPDGVVDALRIIDTKSGKIAYPGPMSVQLATYSRSDLYNPATGERTPLEGVSHRWGLIVHVQQDGEVPPGLYWLNLEHGHQGLELCRLVRGWRKVKPAAILQPVEGLGPDDAAAALEPAAEEEPPPATAEPVTAPAGVVCVRGGASAGDVETVAQFAQFLEGAGPAPAPGDQADAWDAAQLILAAVTTADLDLLWRRDGASWDQQLVGLAMERHQELQERQQLEQPRAALVAALSTADGPTLRQLWDTHAGTVLWTEAHAEAARRRYDQLQATTA